uniref:Uncharacterized protein n=1 Tax=Anguilla anguilla TaxID=7936 RepID=A0A0E9VI76_ANGAN
MFKVNWSKVDFLCVYFQQLPIIVLRKASSTNGHGFISLL